MTQDELLEQWEPKVHSMLRNISIAGMEREDLEQEMRICILKAHKGWDSTRGASFHTYLHQVMQNSIYTLMHRSRVVSKSEPLENLTIRYVSIVQHEPTVFYKMHISGGELLLLDMLLCGYKFSEVSKMVEHPKELVKVRSLLKKRFSFLKNKGE